jgi:phage tail sheath protein FI
MVTFLSSIVQVIEEDPPIGTLPELDSAVPAFVGLTERGVLTPVEVNSWDEYVQNFGGYSVTAGGTTAKTAQVPLAVRQFFLNGGRKAVILRRLLDTAVTATVSINDRQTGDEEPTLKLDASSAGVWGNSLAARISAPTSGETDEFNLEILKDSVVVESFPNVSMTDTDSNFVEEVVNDESTGSLYVVATDLDSTSTLFLPIISTWDLATGSEGTTADMAAADYTGGDDFGALEASDITMLAVPDAATSGLAASVHASMITFCEVTRNNEVFAVYDPIASQTYAQARTQFNALAATEPGACYWPRVKIPNPDKSIFGTDDLITIPPSGGVCGICARNDANKRAGPFVQPAGIDDGRLYGAVDLETDTVLKKSVRDTLYPDRINPIQYKKGNGIYVDGCRTHKSTGSFPSVGERRGISYIETTLKNGLDWVRHQNNTAELRGKVERTVRGYLLDWTDNGAFASTDPDQAFFVDGDVDGIGINNARVRAQNKLYVRVGIATAKPGEYVIILVSQDTRALNEATLGKQA